MIALELEEAFEKFSQKPPIGTIPEEWQSVIDIERESISRLIEDVFSKNNQLEKPERNENPIENQTAIARMLSSVYHHRNQIRNDGSRYSNHLIEVARQMVKYGFTDLHLLAAAVGHDAIEDIDEVRENSAPLFFSSLYQEVSTDSSYLEQQKEIDLKIRKIIEGVTKPVHIKDKKLRNEAYLKLLLENLLVDGKSTLVKIFDRLHNMLTLESKKANSNSTAEENLQKKIAIARETYEVFVPLCQRFSMFEVQEVLTRLCLKYLNPQLLHDFDQEIQLRMADVTENETDPKYWEKLKSKIKPEVYIESSGNTVASIKSMKHELTQSLRKQGITARLFFPHSIESITLTPHLLISRLDRVKKKQIEEITLQDLALPKRDSILDITVIVDTEEDIQPTINELATLFNSEVQINNSYGYARGKTIKGFGPEYSPLRGKAYIRVNCQRDEALSLQGCFAVQDHYGVPQSIANQTRELLRRANERQESIVSVTKELLHPIIKVTTYELGSLRHHDLPNGTTARQLYKHIHGITMPKGTRVKIHKGITTNRWEFHAINYALNKPLPHGYTVIFEKDLST